MRIVFAGTPDFSVPCLQALIDSEHEVVAVYTQPDRPKGRGRQLTPPPVKVVAEAAGIPVLQPENFKEAATVEQLRAWQPDYLVVVAYGLLLSEAVLAIPNQRPINVHASLLPRWRGASPIQQAILAGDAETGVTIMEMVKKMDAGDQLHQLACPIAATDTSQSLHDKLSQLGARALLEYLQRPASFLPISQEESAVTYAGKISKEQAQLDWQKPAVILEREVRAFTPWPIAQLRWKEQTWRVWQASARTEAVEQAPGTVLAVSTAGIEVATAAGVLRIERWQRPGGKPVTIRDHLNAASQQPVVGDVFE